MSAPATAMPPTNTTTINPGDSMPPTATDSQIRDLRREALEAGDEQQVLLCDFALATLETCDEQTAEPFTDLYDEVWTRTEARAECARVIADAHAAAASAARVAAFAAAFDAFDAVVLAAGDVPAAWAAYTAAIAAANAEAAAAYIAANADYVAARDIAAAAYDRAFPTASGGDQ